MTPSVVVPLVNLMFCADCEGCFEVGYRRCPGCASAQILSLAKFLNRTRNEVAA